MKLLLPTALILGLLMIPARAEMPTRSEMKDAAIAFDRGDFATALRAFLPLAGVPQARYDLGLMYATGRGVPRDSNAALQWYRLAADQGFAPAQYEYARLLIRDDAAAASWLRRAADQGYAPAAFHLGLAYRRGAGVARSDAESARWYRAAAEAGLPAAQVNLGLLYERGEGVTPDDAEALRWYRRAADQGLAEAQFNLAAMLEDGRGTAPNAAEAASWYRQAANQGVVAAMNNLGVAYEKGEAIQSDSVMAFTWYEAAALRAGSGEAAEQAGRNRDNIAARLSIDDVARARAQAQQIVARLATPAAPSPSPSPPVIADKPRVVEIQERVVEIQESLKSLGYDCGTADGRMGAKTIGAIRAFQEDAGAPVTGDASEVLALGLRMAVAAKLTLRN